MRYVLVLLLILTIMLTGCESAEPQSVQKPSNQSTSQDADNPPAAADNDITAASTSEDDSGNAESIFGKAYVLAEEPRHLIPLDYKDSTSLTVDDAKIYYESVITSMNSGYCDDLFLSNQDFKQNAVTFGRVDCRESLSFRSHMWDLENTIGVSLFRHGIACYNSWDEALQTVGSLMSEDDYRILSSLYEYPSFEYINASELQGYFDDIYGESRIDISRWTYSDSFCAYPTDLGYILFFGDVGDSGNEYAYELQDCYIENDCAVLQINRHTTVYADPSLDCDECMNIVLYKDNAGIHYLSSEFF